MKKNPPIFEGITNLFVVEELNSILEKIFGFIQIVEIEKVACAIYMMRNDAMIWWDVVKKS